MVAHVHIELMIDGSEDVWVVEMGEDVGEDDGVFFLPGGPSFGSGKAVE
jgi:hypothetical protein